jgi:hypothetical protein
MPARALSIALVLVAGDYLAWRLATDGQWGVGALVTGLALPPLAVVLCWICLLIAVGGVRRLGSGVWRRARPTGTAVSRAAAGEEPQATRQGSNRRIAA